MSWLPLLCQCLVRRRSTGVEVPTVQPVSWVWLRVVVVVCKGFRFGVVAVGFVGRDCGGVVAD